ncbi:MAG TPA: AMP nucleosidase, partial [Sphingomonadaceae bacterium]|nr:AMP nucleosidase [Sphingomonadaceae bacterium]
MNLTPSLAPSDAIAQLSQFYDQALSTLRADILAYAENGALPDAEKRLDGSYCYPELLVHFTGDGERSESARAYGRLQVAGTY